MLLVFELIKILATVCFTLLERTKVRAYTRSYNNSLNKLALCNVELSKILKVVFPKIAIFVHITCFVL